MERIITSLLLIFSTDFFIESFPIKNGFNIKFKPILYKEEVHPKTFGALFAKISQEFTPEAILRREIFAKSFPGPPPELGMGCSNQVARMMFPVKIPGKNDSADTVWTGESFLNLPIIKQPYKDYKILVAAAPPDIKIGRGEESKKVVIYIIFSEDGAGNKDDFVSMPEIYFVNKPQEVNDEVKKEKSNPEKIHAPGSLIIIDNNRTVTGLKSKNVEKVIKFKNSLLNNAYNYELLP